MLGKKLYYNKSIRLYTACFGSLFDDLKIVRESDNTEILIPIKYAAKQKVIQRYIQRQRDDTTPIRQRMQLPTMYFVLESMEYAPNRAKQNLQYAVTDNSEYVIQYEAVPYNFKFTLSVLTESIADNLAAIEQILPRFTPQYNIKVKDNPLLPNVASDIPVVLDYTNLVQDYEGMFDDNRKLIFYELGFTVKGRLFASYSNDDSGFGGVIKHVDVNLRDFVEQEDVDNLLMKFEADVVPDTAEINDVHTISETVTTYV